MNKFLSTYELELYIKEKYLEKLKIFLKEDVKLEGVFFDIGYDNSPEGTYVYTNENGYNYLFTEKGKIREHQTTNEIFQITYWVIDQSIFSIALKYATHNRDYGMDFRRKLFEKEREVWFFLDNEGYNQKCYEIENVLKENPYIDKIK